MYPPTGIKPLTCIFEPRTFIQVSRRPSRGASVPCMTSTTDPPYILTAVNSCPSGKKKPPWGALTWLTAYQIQSNKRANISLLTKCINCQSALHNVLSCILLHVCPAPLRHIRPPRLRLVCTVLATFYLSHHSVIRHIDNDQQN